MNKPLQHLLRSGMVGRIGDLDLHVAYPQPKIRLRSGLCSPEFEREFNAWLMDMFGYTTVVEPGKVYISSMYGFAVMHPRDAATIMSLV